MPLSVCEKTMKAADPTPHIRIAEESDRQAIERIAEAAYAMYLDRMDIKPFPMLDDYAEHIRNGHAYVLTDEQGVQGYVILMDEAPHSLLLDNIAVHPSSQGTGYGQCLARFAEEEGRKRGHSRICLYTNEVMAENLAWYARLGYSVTRRAVEKGYRRVYMAKKI